MVVPQSWGQTPSHHSLTSSPSPRARGTHSLPFATPSASAHPRPRLQHSPSRHRQRLHQLPRAQPRASICHYGVHLNSSGHLAVPLSVKSLAHLALVMPLDITGASSFYSSVPWTPYLLLPLPCGRLTQRAPAPALGHTIVG